MIQFAEIYANKVRNNLSTARDWASDLRHTIETNDQTKVFSRKDEFYTFILLLLLLSCFSLV